MRHNRGSRRQRCGKPSDDKSGGQTGGKSGEQGYLVRKPNPADGRSQLLYATERSRGLKNSKAKIEGIFSEWLLSELPKRKKRRLCKTLDTLCWKSKRQRQADLWMWPEL